MTTESKSSIFSIERRNAEGVWVDCTYEADRRVRGGVISAAGRRNRSTMESWAGEISGDLGWVTRVVEIDGI